MWLPESRIRIFCEGLRPELGYSVKDRGKSEESMNVRSHTEDITNATGHSGLLRVKGHVEDIISWPEVNLRYYVSVSDHKRYYVNAYCHNEDIIWVTDATVRVFCEIQRQLWALNEDKSPQWRFYVNVRGKVRLQCESQGPQEYILSVTNPKWG